MHITPDFMRTEIDKQSYEISLHADDERIADGLTVSQLELALSHCEVIEQYQDDPRGESCLAIGFTPEGIAVHVVCGKNPSGHLILITVYIRNYSATKAQRLKGEEKANFIRQD